MYTAAKSFPRSRKEKLYTNIYLNTVLFISKVKALSKAGHDFGRIFGFLFNSHTRSLSAKKKSFNKNKPPKLYKNNNNNKLKKKKKNES